MQNTITSIYGKLLATICVIPTLLVFLLIKIAVDILSFFKGIGMAIFGSQNKYENKRGFYVAPTNTSSQSVKINWKMVGIIFLLVASVNLNTYWVFNFHFRPVRIEAPKRLYLMDKADRHILDTDSFERKVHAVSSSLDIPPEWLMAVMYSESKLNPAVTNHRGSGATGLIQFMVPTVRELNARMGTAYYMSDIKSMPAHHQMDLVFEYLQTVRERYGEFNSLTELYLAILYPKALGQHHCYTMYSKPTKMYRQNSGLDENKDGSVTVCDIDERMQRLFPTAYMVRK